ncbi:hypothetical protein [Alienimonas sp. DA493]|uniref:hypothetical protein n=1 Tax=Alienimonas sp. DA493 TaxID=3373605 RepID=UPI003754AC2D
MYAAAPTTWLMLLVALAALLLIVVPLVAGIALAVRGRPGVGAVLGGAGLVAALLIGGYFSLSASHHGAPGPRAVWERDEARRESVLHVYQEDHDYARLRTRFADDDRVHVGPGGVYVREGGREVLIAPAPAHGPEGDAWRDAARRHEERLLQRRRRDGAHGPRVVDPAAEAELVSEEELPDWVTDPPANRVVVTGPLVTDEDGGPAAARRAAEEVMVARLLEDADLPPDAAINRGDVPHPARAVVQTLARTTGENEFTLYRGHLLVDASDDVLERLRQGYRNRLGERRALWAVGAGGACVVLFAGLWGVGRRKLRTTAAGANAGEEG